MKKLFLALVAVLAVTISANAASYTVNDEAVDALIEAAAEVSPMGMEAVSEAMATAGATVSSGNGDAVVGILLNFFLGGFGIHRHYLGTRPWMWAIYTFTIGGIFGIVPFVDFIVQILDLVEGAGAGRLAGNTKFIAWA